MHAVLDRTPDRRVHITVSEMATAPARWTRVDTAALVLVLAAAALLRFVSLGRPVELVFDEIFYARDACWYVVGTEAACGITELTSRAHPPLGKWLILSLI